MRRSDMASTHHERPAGVARRCQAIEHRVCASSAESRDVLSEYPSGSQLLHDPQVLEPQSAALTVETRAFPCDRDVLAGEAARDEVDWFEVVLTDLSNVSVARHVGPMSGQNASCEVVDLNLPPRFPTRALEPEVNAADAGEERAERGHLMPPCNLYNLRLAVRHRPKGHRW
jgi:hypothetical protein